MNKTILITNDDGIDAAGIKFLISFLRPLGKLVVVAPETGMSGMGHAVTIKNPLRIKHLPNDGDVERYTTTGTPADCVKLGLNQILKQKPDLIVSGINHGGNHSINVLYSGTMAAAIEGAMQNIPSAGFSMCNPNPKIDFSFMESYVQEISARPKHRHRPWHFSTAIPHGDHQAVYQQFQECLQEKDWLFQADRRKKGNSARTQNQPD